MEILLVIIIIVCVWYLCRHIPLRSRTTDFCKVFLSEYRGRDFTSYWESVYNVFCKMDYPFYLAHSMTDAILSESTHISSGLSGVSSYLFDGVSYDFNY